MSIGFGTPSNVKQFSDVIGRAVRRFIKPPVFNRGSIGQHVLPAPGQKYTQQFIKKLTVDLSVSRTDQVQFISGTIFWLYRVYNTADGTPNTTTPVQVRIADLGADQLTFYGGNGIEGVSYNRVYLSNAATAGVACEIAYFSDSPETPARFF